MSTQSRINYLFIAVTLFYAIFTLLFKFRGVYYIELFLMVIAYIATGTQINCFKIAFRNKVISIWLLWLIYSYTVWRYQGISSMENELFFISNAFLLPISIMFFVYIEACKNMKRTTLFLLCVETTFVLLGLLLQSRGSGSGTGWDARGGSDLGNALPLNAVVMSFFSLWAYIKGYIKRKHLIALLVVSLMGIFFTSTRKALGAWSIGIIFFSLTQFDYHKPSNLFKLIGLVIVAYVAYQLMMNYTMMGQRFNEVDSSAEWAMREYQDVWWLKPLGDRALHYILAWELFVQHPIFGIGLNNFQYFTDFPVPIHSEYMVQLCECGIIGFSLYVLFNYNLIRRIFKFKKAFSNNEGLILLSAISGTLFLSLTAWFYDTPYIFAQYGIIVAAVSSTDFSKVGIIRKQKLNK